MKKLICFLLCLIMLATCVPAVAASLKPENIYGTWVMYQMVDGGEVYDTDFLEQYGQTMTMLLHADGTGKITITAEGEEPYISSIDWAVKNNTLQVTESNGAESVFKPTGKNLYFGDSEQKVYLTRTSDKSGKTTTKAITSLGTYKLNNSKKTASFTIVASRSRTSLTIPDTIKANGKKYSVTEIGAKSCANMKKLTTLVVGKNVKTIRATAFIGDTKLKKITFKGGLLTKVGSKAFANVHKGGTVFCPTVKIKKYQDLLKKGGLPQSVKFKGK